MIPIPSDGAIFFRLFHISIPNPIYRPLMVLPTLCRHARPNLPKCCRRLPSRAFTRILDFSVKLIDLFESQALGFVDHKVDKRNAQEATGEPDEEYLGLQIGIAGPIVDQVWGGVGDGPIEEPVGGRCHREALGADLKGEQLSCYNPILKLVHFVALV
jgi:hypothetical protein